MLKRISEKRTRDALKKDDELKKLSTFVKDLKSRGYSNSAIAYRTGKPESSIRKILDS